MPDLMYLELKSGYNDNGPAWIGYVKASKSGRTLYWNDHAFQKYNGGCSNYVDIETGDEYWISGVKKARHQPPLGRQRHHSNGSPGRGGLSGPHRPSAAPRQCLYAG